MRALLAASAVLCQAAGKRELTAVAASEHWQANGYSTGEIQVLHDGARDDVRLVCGAGAIHYLAIVDDERLAVGQGDGTTVFDLKDGTVAATQEGLLEGTALKHDYHFALRTDRDPAVLFYASWTGAPAFEEPLPGAVKVTGFQFSPAQYDGYDEGFVVIAYVSDGKQVVGMFDMTRRSAVPEFAAGAPGELGRWSKSGNAYEVLRPEVGVPTGKWRVVRRFFVESRAWEKA